MEEQVMRSAPRSDERPSSQKKPKTDSLYDSLVIWVMVGLVVLLPIFFIPTTSVPFLFTKTALASSLITVSLVFYIVARLQSRTFSFAHEWLLHALWGIPFAYLLSALFSGTTDGFIGQALSVDSVAFVVVACVGAFLLSVAVITRVQMLMFFMAFLASFGVLALYQLIRLFVDVQTLSFGIFLSSGSGPFGLLNELGMFFGLISILSLITIIGLRLSGWPKILVSVSLAVSLVFLTITNVSIVWWLVGFASLGTFVFSVLQTNVYKQDTDESTGTGGALPGGAGMFGSLIVLALSLIFLFGSSGLTSSIASMFNIGQLDIRPSLQTTLEIGQAVYGENFLFGSGPGSFSNQWALYRPEVINQTIVWNTDFNTSIGYLPTSFITTGAVGALAWLVFLGLFIWTGVRVLLLRTAEDPLAYYLSLASYIAALYLWILAIVANPNATLLLFAFLLTGLFVASLRHTKGGLREISVSFVDRPRIGFVTVLALTVVVLGSVASMFAVGEKYAASVYFQSGVVQANTTGNLDQAFTRISRALVFDEQARFYRLASSIDLARLSQIIVNNQNPTDEERGQFQSRLARAIESANRATELDPNNYQNWLQLAEVYRAIVPLGIEGSYESAKQAYDRASALRPYSPGILLSQAQLEIAEGDTDAAEVFAREAIATRPNYSDAIFLLAQLQVSKGDIDAAITSVEAATFVAPNNPVAFFQLGLLRYSQENYQGTVAAMSSAVRLNPVYANARYFLGLSYYWLDNTEAALAEFNSIKETNPNNQEIDSIIANMQAGLNPFSGEVIEALPPAEVEPDITALDSLPIEEDDPIIETPEEDLFEASEVTDVVEE